VKVGQKYPLLTKRYLAFRTPEKIDSDFVQSTHYFGGISPSSGVLYSSDSPVSSNKLDIEEAKTNKRICSQNKNERADSSSDNVHYIFDQSLIGDGNTCQLSGVRSIIDVPASTQYPGSLSGLAPVMAAMISYVMKPFRRLNITTTEFATLQAICFFDPGNFLLILNNISLF
jgi:hypothetical protein